MRVPFGHRSDTAASHRTRCPHLLFGGSAAMTGAKEDLHDGRGTREHDRHAYPVHATSSGCPDRRERPASQHAADTGLPQRTAATPASRCRHHRPCCLSRVDKTRLGLLPPWKERMPTLASRVAEFHRRQLEGRTLSSLTSTPHTLLSHQARRQQPRTEPDTLPRLNTEAYALGRSSPARPPPPGPPAASTGGRRRGTNRTGCARAANRQTIPRR